MHRFFFFLALALSVMLSACGQIPKKGSSIFDIKPIEHTKPTPAPVAHESNASSVRRLPSFQWPPPKPSTYTRLSAADAVLLKKSTFGQIASALEGELKSAGYSQFSYYSVPTGIAMATQIERIHRDGTPYSVPYRWNASNLSLDSNNWSLLNYLKTLIRANPGHYRVMVFLLTHEDLSITFSASPESEAAIRGFAENGAINLPKHLRDTPSEGYGLTILVYEIKRQFSGEPATVQNLGLSVQDHIRQSNINF